MSRKRNGTNCAQRVFSFPVFIFHILITNLIPDSILTIDFSIAIYFKALLRTRNLVPVSDYALGIAGTANLRLEFDQLDNLYFPRYD